MPRTFRSLLGSVALTLVSAALASGAAEAILREISGAPLVRRLPEVRYDPHPVRRFTLRPSQNAFTFGAPATVGLDGFRFHGAPGREGSRIVALGDSFTFGLGVRDEDTWPAQLEARQRARSRPVSVVNAGTISYGVYQEMDLLREKVPSLAGTTVIHGLYWNDWMSAGPPKEGEPQPLTAQGYFSWDDLESRPRGLSHQAWNWAGEHSALLFNVKRSARALLDRNTGTSAYARAYRKFLAGEDEHERWAPIDAFYGELSAAARAAGGTAYAVIIPDVGLVGRSAGTEHPFVRWCRASLDRHGVSYVDGFEVWARRGLGREMFLPYNDHLSADGYRVLAEEMDALLARQGERP